MKRIRSVWLVASLLVISAAPAAAQTITTISGNGSTIMSGDGGPALSAGHSPISAITRDGNGNIFVVEYQNYRIRKISPSGVITHFAGTGQPVVSSDTESSVGDGGPAVAAAISPSAIAADAAGNVYFTDVRHHRIRKVTPGGIISTVAGNGLNGWSGDGGPATQARLHELGGVAVDGAGAIYISTGERIRKVSPGGIISTIAGAAAYGFAGDGGPATAALLHVPLGLAVDGAGNLFVADSENMRVRKISAGGIITTVAGGGWWEYDFDATKVSIGKPFGVAVDSKGYVYLQSNQWGWIRKVSPQGVLANAAGFRCPYQHCYVPDAGPLDDGGSAFTSQVGGAIAIAADDSLLLGGDRSRIRKVSPSGPAVPPVATNVLQPFVSLKVEGTAVAVAMGDFDGDGRNDVALVTQQNFGTREDENKLLLYRQLPDGSLGAPVKVPHEQPSSRLTLAMADVNHDGRKDILLGRAYDVALYRGNAQGALVAESISDPGMQATSPMLVVADADADGNVDLITIGRNNVSLYPGVWVLKGDGKGGFPTSLWREDPPVFDWWTANRLSAGDIDGDGDVDLLVGGYNSTVGYFLNRGNGIFDPGVRMPKVGVNGAPVIGDFNGDGRNDLVFAGGTLPSMFVYLRDANGRFDEPHRFINPMGSADLVLPADMNGDGRPDLMVLRSGWALAYFQNGPSGYELPRLWQTPSSGRGDNAGEMVIGRLDADGCNDVVMASVPLSLLVFRGQNCQAPAARRDLDANGLADALWVSGGDEAILWPDHDASRAVRLAPGAGWSLAATGDYDGNQREELLWRHCASGRLARWESLHLPSRPALLPGRDPSWKIVASADFDGDGHSDLLWQHASGATERWSSGDPSTRRRGASMGPGWRAVSTADFDGDHRQDVFWRHSPTGANLVWRAGGSSGALRVTAITDRGWEVAGAADMDGDDRAEVLWRHKLSGRNAIWRSGRFQDRREIASLLDPAWRVAALEDVDGDRRADIVWRHDTGLGLVWKQGDAGMIQHVAPMPKQWRPFNGSLACSPRLPEARAPRLSRP